MGTMRIAVAALLPGFSLPVGAAEYAPWPGQTEVQSERVEFAQKSCCKRCTRGQPCGNTCISKKATCNNPPGCAC